jgi:hypothetical protein
MDQFLVRVVRNDPGRIVEPGKKVSAALGAVNTAWVINTAGLNFRKSDNLAAFLY